MSDGLRGCPTWLPQDPNVPHVDRDQCAEKGPHMFHRAGLTNRYRVEKINDPSGKHADCRYFVLDPQHDPLARIALAAYADAAAKGHIDKGGYLHTPYKRLAADLRAWLRRIESTR